MEFIDLDQPFLSVDDVRDLMTDFSVRAAIHHEGLDVVTYQLGFADGMLAYSKAVLDAMPVLLARAQAVALKKAGEA